MTGCSFGGELKLSMAPRGLRFCEEDNRKSACLDNNGNNLTEIEIDAENETGPNTKPNTEPSSEYQTSKSSWHENEGNGNNRVLTPEFGVHSPIAFPETLQVPQAHELTGVENETEPETEDSRFSLFYCSSSDEEDMMNFDSETEHELAQTYLKRRRNRTTLIVESLDEGGTKRQRMSTDETCWGDRQSLGDMVWVNDQTGEQTLDQTGSQTGEQTKNQIRDQTGEQTRNQIRDQTGEQTKNQIRDQTGEQTGNQSLDQIGSQTIDQAGQQTKRKKRACRTRQQEQDLPVEYLPPTEKRGRYYCPYQNCGKSFSENYQAKLHINDIHRHLVRLCANQHEENNKRERLCY